MTIRCIALWQLVGSHLYLVLRAGWVGPSWNDFQALLCLRIMWLYLGKEKNFFIFLFFFSPSLLDDYNAVSGMLWHSIFLVDSAVSPLQKALVEREDPLCSSLTFVVREGLPSVHYLELQVMNSDRYIMMAIYYSLYSPGFRDMSCSWVYDRMYSHVIWI